MMTPRVSVVMPCYNAAATIDEAVASLVNQTLRDLEIIAINDGSTDDTLDRLQRWAATDARLRIMTQPHSGIVQALTTGLRYAQAPYLARMDADDWSHPQRLARQVALLEADPGLAVVGCRVQGVPAATLRPGFAVYIDWLNTLTSHEAILRQLFVESPLVHPSVVMRRTWIEQVGGYQDHGWPEDYDLWMRLVLVGARLTNVPEVLFAWRDHPGRLTVTDHRYALEQFLRLKAYYLARGPLKDQDSVIIWGTGMMGKRLSKHLLREQQPVRGFVESSPAQGSTTLRGLPRYAPAMLPVRWAELPRPVLLVAVKSRSMQPIIRTQLAAMQLREGVDWWQVA